MTTAFAHFCRAFVLSLAAALVGCAASPGVQRAAEPVQSAPQGNWDVAALEDVLAYARAQKTTGFLIVQHRRTIAEQNWVLPDDAVQFRAAFVHGQAGPALLEDVASQQKSFVALLVGMAVDRGLLDVDRPVSSFLGQGWSKAAPQAEASITVRHLLEMTSGLGEDLRVEAQPGARFFYNTPAYAFTKQVLERVTGRSLDDITQAWLVVPLGLSDTSWRQRPPALADVGNPTGLVTTPADMARVGQLLLDRGLGPDGKRVISVAQLDALLTRTATNPAYGRLWWLNGSDHALRAGAGAPRQESALVPAAPTDLVAALGAHDRKLFVVPSLDLIVVRTGQAAPARDFDQQLWLRLMKALPKRP